MTRAVVVVVAVLVIGWLAVMERDARLQASGTAIAQRSHTAPGALAQADSDLRSARLLNPDTGPDLGRAFVLAARGRGGQAVTLTRSVLAREPDNLGAWAVLYALTRTRDPATAARALAARRRLDPFNAR